MNITPEQIQQLAEDAADNVVAPGAPSAWPHNIRTVRHAIEAALRLNEPKPEKEPAKK